MRVSFLACGKLWASGMQALGLGRFCRQELEQFGQAGKAPCGLSGQGLRVWHNDDLFA